MKIHTLNLFFFLHFLNYVSSQLSPTHNSTMINLSKLLHSQVSWDVTKNPCTWTGVTCSTRDTSVTKLSLSNLELTNSSFLPLACQLDSLEVLDVSKNLLSSIPDEFFSSCGAIRTLKSMNFSLNRVSGPLPSFGNGFTNLESLDLSQNLISGTINQQLNAMLSLKSLNLSTNNFTGSIPVSLGKFKGLEQLQLSSNYFRGIIPHELGDLANLTVLDLSVNNLQGNIPSKIVQLRRLELLVLSANKLRGQVPSNFSRSIERFAANENNLQGSIPSGISRYLKNLDLSYNNLNGSIPNDLLSQPNLQTVDLSYNKLIGNMPEDLSSSLVRLRLGGNSLQGSILAINFSVLQNLTYLELENNALNGTIPSEIGSCQKLSLLNLARNQLSGEIPMELGKLKKLQGLDLQLNKFVGNIPPEITQLYGLTILNISWNSLNGSIPSSISNLGNLTYLHLQENNFSGSIPEDIGSLNSLIELQLGNNGLSGLIPPMPRNLQYSLNISNNLFDERIPETLGQMSQLEILDLSNNRFFGQIPDFLTQMQSLTLLLLDNNNLSGVVPHFGKNVKLETKGNIGLIYPSPDSPNTSKPHRKRLGSVKIAVVVSAALFGGLIAILGIFLYRLLLYRVHDIEVQVQPKHPEGLVPEAIESRILTANTTHKSDIDFGKAMEAVSNPLNLVLRTKFSTYYKADMPSGVSYFVKKLNCTDRIFQPSSQGSFGQELEALGKVKNSNIMTPLAYALAGDNAYLIYEMSFKGTLFDVLHMSPGAPLDWVSRCSIAVGVAQGLASLHGCSSGPILLFNLTSNTIMLKTLKEPQLGDIELCKVIDPSKSTSSLSTVAGSVGYVPPEYAYTMRVTIAGNVYSFGVILLELLTGKQAVCEGTELAKWVLRNSTEPHKWERILDFRISRTSPSVRSQMLAVLKIALACINASSEARPKMKSVLRMLLNAR